MKHDAGPDRDCLVVYPSRIKLGLILVGSLVFVALGVHVARVAEERGIDFWKVVVVSYLGVPFFAYCAAFSAWRLLVRRPALVIDSSGITDAASAAAVGHLAWDEVDRLVLYNFRGQAMLGIFPRDLDRFFERLPLHVRLVARLNLAMGCAPINLPQVGLDMPLLDLALLIQTRSGVRFER